MSVQMRQSLQELTAGDYQLITFHTKFFLEGRSEQPISKSAIDIQILVSSNTYPVRMNIYERVCN